MQKKIFLTPLIVTFFILVFSFFIKTQTISSFLEPNSLNKKIEFNI